MGLAAEKRQPVYGIYGRDKQDKTRISALFSLQFLKKKVREKGEKLQWHKRRKLKKVRTNNVNILE